MIRPFALTALLFTATGCAPSGLGVDPGVPSIATATAAGRVVTITRVIDGDTLEVTGGERVRLLSIQAPELNARTRADDAECGAEGAEAARDALTDLLPPGTTVTLRGLPGEPAKDRYGRTLSNAYVPVDGTEAVNVSLWLVQNGWARAYLEYRTAETAEAARRETQARERGRGMWAICPGGMR
jgi:micrococcal nuclease